MGAAVKIPDWQQDLTWSNQLFLTEVWPRIKERCGGGQIRPVEILKDDEIAKELDVLCGIDIWQVIDGQGARGIASRVQNETRESKKGINWKTFTIRYSRNDTGAKTEYHKRKEAIETGRYIYPFLTCQAYFDHGEFVGGGIARTIDVFNNINLRQKRTADNATFLYVYFDDVPHIWEF